ncbi:MAG: methyltransferase domain-containing protein, partial [Granulosicoccus sp.]|nr:methyltransferase domain-containing protein [Granulosicoccus sp.]
MSSNALSFARQFILAPTSTGAISPASDQLAELMVKSADVSKQQSIVELGPGTGVVTEVIAANLSPGTHFFALELNPVFAEKTRQRCPGVKVYNDNALNLIDQLAAAGLSQCDCILSSLPWTLFDKNLQQKLIAVIASALKPGGALVTY